MFNGQLVSPANKKSLSQKLIFIGSTLSSNKSKKPLQQCSGFSL
ncbi:hypothetical protein PARC_a0786 [Pseudoalteromonas arctica A 37-1-2]|uniref:Uncharacterized protein n=1 Tax=Pseudoalteromonas arctica A 37-1-2 TaxID=1117313 RepID=A0A290S1T4_9GAMM|nr:hypothetical protein PARC_a0786 [Pseudoalteromonas arctica A 37-1-2]